VTIGKSPDRGNRRPSARTSRNAPGQPEQTAEPLTTDLPSIGRILTVARIDAGLTVDQVSSTTRVRVPIVHDIEQDDFSRCGGDFYARGHIRALARAVGVDGDELVARYDAAHGGAPAGRRPAQLLDTAPIKVKDHRRPNWTTPMVVAIVAVVALIGFNLVSGNSAAPAPGTAGEPLASARPSGASPSAQLPAPTQSLAPIAAAPADKVTVKLVAEKAASWVSAKDGKGKTIFANNLENGQDQTFTDAKQITLVLGNAGAVHVYVNGKDLGPAGADGQVVHVTYTPGDPQAG
jgi:cytoskeletal protein RodZ